MTGMDSGHQADARDAILEAVASTAALLHQPTDTGEAVHEVLHEIGRALAVSRVYIFRNRTLDGELVADIIAEWVAPGVSPQIDEPALQGMPYAAGFDRWRHQLSLGNPVHGRIESFPEDEQDFLAAQQIASLVVSPIFVARQWWGFLGLDDCDHGQTWSDQVLRVLSVAADTLGSALHRRALEERLDEQRRQLEGALRLEALGRLAGGIAHDFNNILTALGAHVGLLEMDAADEALRADLREIQQYVKRGTDLTRQLLAFGGQQSTTPRPVDLGEAVREARSMLRHLVRNGVRLELDVSDQALPVRIDPSQLNQVLLNLVVNARDAIDESGVVTVAARPAPTGDTALLTVADDGQGIAPEALHHLYEPFFTTKGERGTGLGLSIVYGIVSRSGGTIRCSSEPGVGTTFSIELPLSKEITDD